MPFLKNREVARPMVGFSLKPFKVLALGIALFVSGLNAQTAELLWPQGAPGALGTADGDNLPSSSIQLQEPRLTVLR